MLASGGTKILLACLAVVCVMVYGYRYLPASGGASPEDLARQAVEAESPDEQEAAVAALARSSDPAASGLLLDVLRQSKVPAVRAACISGLGAARHFEAMDLLIGALGDESALVRGRAGIAVTRMLGRDYHFNPNAPPQERAAVIGNIQQYWGQIKGTPQFEAYKQQLHAGEKPS